MDSRRSRSDHARFASKSRCPTRWARSALWQTALQLRGGPRFGHERAGIVDLAPGVPEQDAAHPIVGQVVDDALAERRLPVGDRAVPGVDLADRFVAEIEEIRIEEGHVLVPH